MNLQRMSLNIFAAVFSTACAHSFTTTVPNVDRDRFMGAWYVQAGRFTALEKDVFNSVERYSWNEKEQQIDIDFSYNKGSFDGPLKKIPQTATIENKSTNATWKVSPMWPLKFTYLIIGLDNNYEWTAIGVPSQKYLWIMTRDPHFNKERIKTILDQLASKGYDTKEIEYVPHK